jgi:hypothetical protein
MMMIDLASRAELSPEQKLAVAVIAEAARDLIRTDGQDLAAAWFLQGGGRFEFWCYLAGLDPEEAARRGRALVKGTGAGLFLKTNEL